MIIEQQVCSLELAKRLKELGVKQESLFYWQFFPGHNFIIHDKDKSNHYETETYSAFTVAELGEMLPDWNESVKRAYKDWVCIIRNKNTDINWHSFGETEANARSKMLIYLLENGLIKNEK
jgi:hypothetical protein